MQTLDVNQLRPEAVMRRDLYHPSGKMLIAAGGPLTASYIAAMKQAGVQQVCSCENDEDVREVLRRAPKSPVPLKSLAVGKAAPYNLYNRQGALLLKGGKAITAEQMADLQNNNVSIIYRLDPQQLGQSRHVMDAVAGHVVRRLDYRTKDEESLRLRPLGEPASNFIDNFRTARSAEDIDAARTRLTEARNVTDDVFSRLADGKTLYGEEVAETSNVLMETLLEDKNLLVSMACLHPATDSMIVDHTINVTLLAMTIGIQMGAGVDQLARLGRAAMLHDIGMLAVPADLLLKEDPLTDAERLEIARHPIRGLAMLEQIRGHDEEQQFVIYQEHERENGLGYPKRRGSRWIADMARIIAVADTFEALTSPRPYRNALLPHEAMAEVVRLTAKGQLHVHTVRLLLAAVGLFPIGSLVELNDGSVGRVVAVNPQQYDRPVLAILRDPSQSTLKESMIDLSTVPKEQLRVVKAIGAEPFHIDQTEGLIFTGEKILV